jgi:hypothetical protein
MMKTRNEQTETIIPELPEEVLLEILKNVGASNSKSISLTSQAFNRIWQDEKIWKEAVMRDFPSQYAKLKSSIINSMHANLLTKDISIDDKQLENFMARYLKRALKTVEWKKYYINLKERAYVGLPEDLINAFECVRQGKCAGLMEINLNWKKITTPDKTGNSILSLCIHLNDETILHDLYNLLATRTDSTLTPLHFAMECRQDKNAAELIEGGIDLNIDPSLNDEPYLFTALGTDSLATCESLLNHGANTETIGADGDTVICTAAAEGKLEFVELLVRKGADATACGNEGEGYNVLSSALRHPRVVQYLVQESVVDINSYDERGFTCLHNAIRIYSELNPNDFTSRYNIIKNIEYLLEHGADPRLVSRGDIDDNAAAGTMAINVLPKDIQTKMSEKAHHLEIGETANAGLGMRRNRE